MNAPLVRDKVLDEFKIIYRERRESAVQPLSALPHPKGIMRDVLLSVAKSDETQIGRVQDQFWQLARFQPLSVEQTDLVERWERSRMFPGGCAQSYEEHVALMVLNGEMNRNIEEDRARYRVDLADKLSGTD